MLFPAQTVAGIGSKRVPGSECHPINESEPPVRYVKLICTDSHWKIDMKNWNSVLEMPRVFLDVHCDGNGSCEMLKDCTAKISKAIELHLSSS